MLNINFQFFYVNRHKTILLALLIVFFGKISFCQNNNGVLDTITDLYKKENFFITMHDGVKLNTDVYFPILTDNFKTTFNIPLPGLGQSDSIILLHRGTMLYKYVNQPDSNQIPTIFLRTPYDSRGAGSSVFIFPLIGYNFVVQDERGRYLSEGTFAPFINDGWVKAPYNLNRFFLDPSPDSAMLNTFDGIESIQYISDSLQVDTNFDGIKDFYLSNHAIGMYGGSAEGYSQYQAAAAKKNTYYTSPLKCLLPLVATGEFQQSTSAPNGIYREALVKGWLTHVMSNMDTNSFDPSIYNNIHTPLDYGLNTIQELIDTTIYTYTKWKGMTYPNSPYRTYIDISSAKVNSLGESAANGLHSRYSNMDIPIMHVTGWWDIFVEGQIATFLNTRNNISDYAKHRQKLVIGPWTHQTITMNEIGDQRGIYAYPNSVFDIFGNFGDVNTIASSDNFIKLLNSELITWYRAHLGEPVVVFPENYWQQWSSTSSYKVKIPSKNYQLSFEEYINFLLGLQGLNQFPISLKDTTTGTITDYFVNIPASGTSIFGDTAHTVFHASTPNYDETQSTGIKAVRMYIVGPTNDSLNVNTGNYWVARNFFPSGDLNQKWFFNTSDYSIDTIRPMLIDSGMYIADPRNPVQTIGGGNMVIMTPDLARKNNGQMNLATWDSLTMTRNDVLAFESPILTDTLSVIGTPTISLWIAAAPVNSPYPDSVNCDFIVRIIDVYPDGRQLYVTEGAMNVRAREYVRSKALNQENCNAPFSNIKSNKIYNLFFKSLPLGYTFGKGHKIKVLVSSSNYPRYQSNPNIPLMPNDFIRFDPTDSLTYNFYGHTLSPQKIQVKLFSGDSLDSYIILPVFNNVLLNSNTIEKNTPGKPKTLNQTLLYPNPTTNRINIDAKTNINALTLFDSKGNIIFNQSNINKKHFVLNLKTLNLAPGEYNIRIKTQNNRIFKKIIFTK